MKRTRLRHREPEPETADARAIENPDVEFDLDTLMAKVRAAANAGDAVAGVLAADAQDAAKGEPLDILQVIGAQVEWNNHTTKTLAALADCLRHIQNELTALQNAIPAAAIPSARALGARKARLDSHRTGHKRSAQINDSTKRRRRRR